MADLRLHLSHGGGHIRCRHHLGTDIFGLQSFDCAALADKDVVLSPEWPLAVYFYSARDRKVYERAAKRLQSIYGDEQEALWCYADKSLKTTVKELLGSYAKASSSAVIYLPATTAPASKVGCGDDLGRVSKDAKAPAWVKE